MPPFHLFTGIAVSDLDRAREWYGRFFGSPPTMVPNDTELVWDLAERRSAYLRLRPEAAGHAELTLFLDHWQDLESEVARIAGLGIDPALSEDYGNGVRKVTYGDPDGNEVGLGSMPAS